MENGGFLFNPLSDKPLNKLTVIQNNSLRIAVDYRKSTPINLILAEAKEPPISLYEFLGLNDFINSEHPLNQGLGRLNANIDNPTFMCKGSNPLLPTAYEKMIRIQHFIGSVDRPLCCAFFMRRFL